MRYNKIIIFQRDKNKLFYDFIERMKSYKILFTIS